MASGTGPLQAGQLLRALSSNQAESVTNAEALAQLDLADATKQGNIFNGPDQLTRLDSSGRLPALDTSLGIYLPETYGAVGDGVTDDHDAIQDAMDAAADAGGGIVQFGPRSYLNGDKLVPAAGVTLQGVGLTTILKAKPGDPPGANNRFIDVQEDDVTIKSMVFDFNGSVEGLFAGFFVYALNCSRLNIQNVRVDNLTSNKYGIYLNGVSDANVDVVSGSGGFATNSTFCTALNCSDIKLSKVLCVNCGTGIAVYGGARIYADALLLVSCSAGLFNNGGQYSIFRGIASSAAVGDSGICTGAVYEFSSADAPSLTGTGGRYIDLDTTSNLGYFTPEQFGAVGDGVTDDTAAFTAALNACTGLVRTVLCAPKTYLVAGISFGNQDIHLKGVSDYTNSTILLLANTTNTMFQNALGNCSVEDLVINFNFTSGMLSTAAIVDFSGSNYNYLKNVHVINVYDPDPVGFINLGQPNRRNYIENVRVNYEVWSNLEISERAIIVHPAKPDAGGPYTAYNDWYANGNALIRAYALAKNFDGSNFGVSSAPERRVTIVLNPGVYAVKDGSFIMSAECIDLQGLGKVIIQNRIYNANTTARKLISKESEFGANGTYVVRPGAVGSGLRALIGRKVTWNGATYVDAGSAVVLPTDTCIALTADNVFTTNGRALINNYFGALSGGVQIGFDTDLNNWTNHQITKSDLGGGIFTITEQNIADPGSYGINLSTRYGPRIPYCFSFKAKYRSCQWISVQIGLVGVQVNATFDIQNGICGTTGLLNATSEITSEGGGWYRCTIRSIPGAIYGAGIYTAHGDLLPQDDQPNGNSAIAFDMQDVSLDSDYELLADNDDDTIPSAGIAIRQTATDVKIRNVHIKTFLPDWSNSGLNRDEFDPAAYFPESGTNTTVLEDVIFEGSTTAESGTYDGAWGMRILGDGGNWAGTYTRVKGGYHLFMTTANGVLSGTFIDCESTGNESFYASESGGDISGIFRNCRAIGTCFTAYGGIATGTFENCDMGNFAFTGCTVSALLLRCKIGVAVQLTNGARIYQTIITANDGSNSVSGTGTVTIAGCIFAGGIGVGLANTVTTPYNVMDVGIT